MDTWTRDTDGLLDVQPSDRQQVQTSSHRQDVVSPQRVAPSAEGLQSHSRQDIESGNKNRRKEVKKRKKGKVEEKGGRGGQRRRRVEIEEKGGRREERRRRRKDEKEGKKECVVDRYRCTSRPVQIY